MSERDEHPTSVERPGLPTAPIYGPSGTEPDTTGAETMPSDEPRKLAERDRRRIVKICKSCMVSQHSGGDFCVRCGEQLEPIRSVQHNCIGEVVGDKYTIVEKIGAGGMGEVYLGLNKPIGQRVAIKFLNEKFTSDEEIVLRFLNEARSYCMVNHPNAVTLLEYGQHDNGALYLITEYIEGQHLSELVEKSAPLAVHTLVPIALQVCEVLSAAHEQGVIHRDLKPDNLMLIPGSRGQYAVKVLDFGISKIADDNIDGPMTETGSVFGTPEFMSPEQARGNAADPRTDLYSLGVILYYMATGTLPFSEKTKFATLNRQLHADPQPPGQVVDDDVHIPKRLEKLILRCLEKSPKNRPTDADEVARTLEQIGRDQRARTTAEPPAASPQRDRDDAQLEADDEQTGPQEDCETALEKPIKEVRADTVALGFDSEHEFEPDGFDGSFDDSNDPVGETGFAGRLDDHRRDAGSQRIDLDDELSDEPSFRIPTDRFRAPSAQWFRTGAIGVAATLAVVGVVMTFTGDDAAESSPGSELSAMEAAHEATASGQHAAVLEVSEQLVEEGEFSRVDDLLADLEQRPLNGEYRERFDELVDRASRGRNTEMQVRAAVDARDCQSASELLERLAELSATAAEETESVVADCDSQRHHGELTAQPQHDSTGRTEIPPSSTAGAHRPEPAGESASEGAPDDAARPEAPVAEPETDAGADEDNTQTQPTEAQSGDAIAEHEPSPSPEPDEVNQQDHPDTDDGEPAGHDTEPALGESGDDAEHAVGSSAPDDSGAAADSLDHAVEDDEPESDAEQPADDGPAEEHDEPESDAEQPADDGPAEEHEEPESDAEQPADDDRAEEHEEPESDAEQPADDGPAEEHEEPESDVALPPSEL